MNVDMIIALVIFGAFTVYCYYDKYVAEKEDKENSRLGYKRVKKKSKNMEKKVAQRETMYQWLKRISKELNLQTNDPKFMWEK